MITTAHSALPAAVLHMRGLSELNLASNHIATLPVHAAPLRACLRPPPLTVCTSGGHWRPGAIARARFAVEPAQDIAKVHW